MQWHTTVVMSSYSAMKMPEGTDTANYSTGYYKTKNHQNSSQIAWFSSHI